MPESVLDIKDDRSLEYILAHVICPLRLPDGDDHTVFNDHALAGAIWAAACAYTGHISDANKPHWSCITTMLENLSTTMELETMEKGRITSQLHGMKAGDVLAYLIRAQNAAVIVRKQEDTTIFESFEVSPMAGAVMGARGKLVCSYPGPAIAIPNDVFSDQIFQSELANYLTHMNEDVLDSAPTSQKARSTVIEDRETAHPRYITELLTGILRGIGGPADIVRISKRIGDDVVWNNSRLPWRRSSLWLLIRVVLQTSLERTALGRVTYKAFMIFFMHKLAQKAIQEDVESELLHFMSAKVSRRLMKLGSSAPDWLSRTALQTCASIRETLEERWKLVQDAQAASPHWASSQLDLERDTQLSLLGSRGHIRDALRNRDADIPHTDFNPKHRPRGSLDDFLSSDGKFFADGYLAEPHLTLYDVEQAVEQGIDDWVARVTNADDACVKLEILADKYSSSALEVYTNDPENLSIMLLTTIELWIALDKVVIKEIPMLADYSPVTPTTLLESLLLRKAENLHRLRHAYQYIHTRHSQSRYCSVFSKEVNKTSFGVRYYETSPRLRDLKVRIEEAAQRERDCKVDELDKANAQHAELSQEASTTDHTLTVQWNGKSVHIKKKKLCSKCQLKKRLDAITIAVHEWPLPDDPLRAAVVVFELDCPISFNMWRSATSHLLVDLCSPSPQQEKPYILLADYTALRTYFVKHPRSRVSLASDSKPFDKTHYKTIQIPSQKSIVCVNNGLTYYGFDSSARVHVSDAFTSPGIKHYCTHQLHIGPYRNLQEYLDGTLHTSNQVLANQADCHEDLSIHEFIAFGHLRSGSSLQWLNILRELRHRTLSFRCDEVYLLLAQAVSQVGPGGEWTWHQELQHPSFCHALLAELESLEKDVAANWLEGVTMRTISLLLSRLLASAPNVEVSEQALKLLRSVREKTFSWVQELSAKLTKSPGDTKNEESRWHLRDMAATCRSTFDAGTANIQHLLHSPEDVQILLSCAVVIHDNTPADLSSSSVPAPSRLLLDRDRRLSLVLEGRLGSLITADDEGIKVAVSKVWPAYRPGSKWKMLQYSNSRWFLCKTAATTTQCSQTVRFNLLDGTLLVDGKPLGRLPKAITRHPVYSLIFGEQVFDVTPSDLPGMEFATRGMIFRHHVHFSLNGGDLVIRAQHEHTIDTWELIAQEKMESDLPAVLVKGHAHWLNLTTSIIEVRPLERLWEPSPENWEISLAPGLYRMHKGSELFVDIRSATWTTISRLLEPLDRSENLIITVSTADSAQYTCSPRLSVELPRYGLSFFVNEDGDLQSRNIRDMVYDKNQSTGTMFGLLNQLVLRPKVQAKEELIQRCVLIPDGDVSYKRHGHHVRIVVDTHCPPLRRVTYQTYKVDTELGCLTGNVSLTNKLYRAYLHALSSSGCSADPLTGRTGTEEALCILWSASCGSFMKLKCRDADLLCLIASLCSTRTWYPKHLKQMQKVEWSCLPATTHHHRLYTAAKAIKEHCERVQLFHENHSNSLFLEFPAREVHLFERASLRAAHLLAFEFSGLLGGECDAEYQARDLLKPTSAEHHAYSAASIIYGWATDLDTTENIVGLFESWGETVHGGNSSSLQSLQYDSTWLRPDLPLVWIRAYNLLRQSNKARQRFRLLFSLPAMAYHSPKLAKLVPTLLAFATNPQFVLEDPPPYDDYDLSRGYSISANTLSFHVNASAHRFDNSPESSIPANPDETVCELKLRQRGLYDGRRAADVDTAVNQLLMAWPSETPPSCRSLEKSSYNMSSLNTDLRTLFSGCYRNLKLKEHLTRVQEILSGAHSVPVSLPQYAFQPCSSATPRVPWVVTVDQLFSRSTPPSLSCAKLPRYTAKAEKALFSGHSGLHQLIAAVGLNSNTSFQREYVDDFHDSAEQLGAETSFATHSRATEKPTIAVLEQHHLQCRDAYFQGLDALKQALGPECMREQEQAVYQSGQWPRITADSLFRCLASTSSTELTDNWKNCLISLTLLGLELQRSRRLLRLVMDNHHEEFFKELENEGCEGWDGEQHPDWLLVQLQGDFLVRRVQANVAFEMISPQSGQNTAMQLHMGEGKSSVIVPIVVAALANGNQLVRVIVPKALTAQMFQLLVDRLGGLTNRRIYYLPFSRSLEIDSSGVRALHEIMQECKREGGILVVQPDHVLSLKLMSVEKQLDEDNLVADELLKLQRWLHSHARDILDESDEILHVRYQLVYTIGLQKHLEGFPERWTTTQQVLGLVRKHVYRLQEHLPLEIECECSPPGSFPRTRILQASAGQELISLIARDVIDGHLANFSFDQVRSGLRGAIRDFISCRDVTSSTIQMVEEYARQSALWNGLLLLRGLLASGILLFALKERRWRVDYGLAPPRTMLAVPYRAKDIPASKAEFGHPDVAIILTCLSYYYGGLTEEQLKTCFEILLIQDNPSLEYELWIRKCPAVPGNLRSLSGVNIKSSEQWNTHLLPLFARTQAVVDFYLSRVVFPKEAKEFPSKLSCSGWDLAENRTHLITGFSGTNDGRYLLPAPISQRDPEHQRGTNARMLVYLLQPENNLYMLTAHENGSRRTAHEFLQMVVVQKPEIRVLLDVGAQMLELRNHELAAAWLKLSPDSLAAIYFNEDDELTVLTRDGTTQLLLSSPFAQQLDQCVVYLDDAHTRGTDIKFPAGCRAAVTLGPKVTKDRLTQGCMRMRKLGHGHSVMFFAPLEVDRTIRSVTSKHASDSICVTDILQWAIHETCNDIQQRASHWAQQGTDHASRYGAWSRFCSNEITPKQLSSIWLQPEAKSLVDLYSPRKSGSSTALAIPEIRQRCLHLGIMTLRDASMDEEQEREVIHEIERERQVERPNKVPPATHSIHRDVIAFVKSGVVPENTKAFLPVFTTLKNTTAAIKEDHVWSRFVLATEDFCKTVVCSAGKADDYLRPVQWIFSGTVAHNPALVVLSPHEVNGLMSEIRGSKHVHLHVYTPRTIESMKPCDDLTLYNVPTVPLNWTPPRALIDQLNVFSGQLYLRDYATYIELCRFLCIYAKDLQDEGDIEVQCDGFIVPQNRPLRAQVENSFQSTPLPALKVLVGLRRKGMRYAPTHMGKILEGRLLTESDFQNGDNISPSTLGVPASRC